MARANHRPRLRAGLQSHWHTGAYQPGTQPAGRGTRGSRIAYRSSPDDAGIRFGERRTRRPRRHRRASAAAAHRRRTRHRGQQQRRRRAAGAEHFGTGPPSARFTRRIDRNRRQLPAAGNHAAGGLRARGSGHHQSHPRRRFRSRHLRPDGAFVKGASKQLSHRRLRRRSLGSRTGRSGTPPWIAGVRRCRQRRPA